MSLGAVLGAIVAKTIGMGSWLDAKLCIVAGATIGGLIQHLLNAAKSSKHGK